MEPEISGNRSESLPLQNGANARKKNELCTLLGDVSLK